MRAEQERLDTTVHEASFRTAQVSEHASPLHWAAPEKGRLEPTQPLLTRYRCHQPPWTIERQGVSHTGMREGGTSHPRFLQHFRVAWGGARQLMIHDLLQIPALGVPMAIKLVSLEIGMNRFLRPYAGSECALWEDTVILCSNECAQ